jgi:hypothetical protein
VLVTILALLLIGGATKWYRGTHWSASAPYQGAAVAGSVVPPAKP